MNSTVERLEVGPWPMNCYLVRSSTAGPVAVVDPGQDGDAILTAVGDNQVCCVLLTHAHPDHIGALDAVRRVTGAPVGIHPADSVVFDVEADFPLLHGTVVEVGQVRLSVSHVPGHTPGSVCLRLSGQALVGDAVFPGGPGHTDTPAGLARSLSSLSETVFIRSDDTVLYPGHGNSTTGGAERWDFERFVAAERSTGLCGDVNWG